MCGNKLNRCVAPTLQNKYYSVVILTYTYLEFAIGLGFVAENFAMKKLTKHLVFTVSVEVLILNIVAKN